MNTDLPDVAVDAHAAAAAITAAAGGVDLARECEADPSRRGKVGDLLAEFGVDDLDPRTGVESAMVAAAICRQAGAVALPYPVVGRLLGRDDKFLAVGPSAGRLRVNHGDIGSWEVADQRGRCHAVTAGAPIAQPLAPFVVDATPGEEVEALPPTDPALWIALEAWVVFGGMERALGLVQEYLPERHQFGRPLAAFQGLRFRVADLMVSLRGVEELAKYTIWSHFDAPEEAMTDALALRAASQEASKRIFQNAHLLHGAIGFCDEHDLSFLNRHLQPNLRLPWDFEVTSSLLLAQIESEGIKTLYGHYGVPVQEPTEERTQA